MNAWDNGVKATNFSMKSYRSLRIVFNQLIMCFYSFGLLSSDNELIVLYKIQTCPLLIVKDFTSWKRFEVKRQEWSW